MRSEVKRADVGGYLKLVPYPEVRRRIEAALSNARLRVEEVPTDSALDRVSAEEVVSPCDIPEFSSSMMDGYALKSAEVRDADASHPAIFRVRAALSPASARGSSRLVGHDACYVATGAPIPAGADAVVKVEETRLLGDRVAVSQVIPRGKNIAPKGDDIRAGSPLVRRGQIVNAADIALLVAAGRKELTVFRKPRVGILSTGDELTRLGSGEKGKKVNNYANLIAAYLSDAGAVPVPLGIASDDEAQIAEKVEKGIGDLDALITIGGSSVGTKDFTSNALRRLEGCEELFHGVRLVPARPTGMFMLGRTPVALLPGHSVAAAIAFFLVVFPMVNILSGLEFDSRLTLIRARVCESISNPRPVGALFLVRLTAEGGVYSAHPQRWGSNLMSSLASANAFLAVGPRTKLGEGRVVTVTLLGGREIQRVPGVVAQ